jgi:hypothetical protein
MMNRPLDHGHLVAALLLGYSPLTSRPFRLSWGLRKNGLVWNSVDALGAKELNKEFFVPIAKIGLGCAGATAR